MKYFDESRGGFWYSSKYRPLMNTLIHIAKMDEIEGVKVLVKKAEGKKCPRCWKIFPGPCIRCNKKN